MEQKGTELGVQTRFYISTKEIVVFVLHKCKNEMLN